jgi:hypothetical protein
MIMLVDNFAGTTAVPITTKVFDGIIDGLIDDLSLRIPWPSVSIVFQTRSGCVFSFRIDARRPRF